MCALRWLMRCAQIRFVVSVYFMQVLAMQEMTVLLRAKLRVWQQLGGPTMTTFIVII